MESRSQFESGPIGSPQGAGFLTARASKATAPNNMHNFTPSRSQKPKQKSVTYKETKNSVCSDFSLSLAEDEQNMALMQRSKSAIRFNT